MGAWLESQTGAPNLLCAQPEYAPKGQEAASNKKSGALERTSNR